MCTDHYVLTWNKRKWLQFIKSTMLFIHLIYSSVGLQYKFKWFIIFLFACLCNCYGM